MNSYHTPRNLPRLSRPAYQGLARVHWVFSIRGRRTGWLNQDFFLRFQLMLTHAFHRYRIVSPCVCLMPDHIHLLWIGTDEAASDQVLAQSFLRTQIKPFLAPFAIQSPPYDHVLRARERNRDAFQRHATYIRENPWRAGLVPERDTPWPFECAVVPGYPDLNVRAPDFWDTFWKIHAKLVVLSR